MKTSKAVQETTRDFYALLASAAAKRAVTNMIHGNYPSSADIWADATERWLKKAGASAAKWRFRMPAL